ncbi:MAG: PH domain-containing protein [Phycisphaerae bacterium]|nr:PH domain-containing protein [Phycisphaerae bacterium]
MSQKDNHDVPEKLGGKPQAELARHFSATMTDSPTGAGELDARPWTELPGGVVDGGEIILLAIKPSMWRPATSAGGWVIAACLLAALCAWFDQPLPGFSVIVTIQVAMLLGALPLGIAILRWIATWYVLTNRRVLTVEGVRSPSIRACLLVELRNTYLHAEPIERQLGLGTITLVTNREHEPPQRWRSISSPEEVHERIRRAIENAIDHQGSGT